MPTPPEQTPSPPEQTPSPPEQTPSPPEQTPTPEKKWHEILLPQAGGLVTALSVAVVGRYGAEVLNKKQDADTPAKVYAELTSPREPADSAMRKDMFAKIIESAFQNDESPD